MKSVSSSLHSVITWWSVSLFTLPKGKSRRNETDVNIVLQEDKQSGFLQSRLLNG